MRSCFLIFFITFGLLEGSKLFFRGRWRGGNIGLPGPKLIANTPKAEWFEQPLDHFNPQIVASWKQRFFRNDTFYRPGGPVFLMIGGEGSITPQWSVQGAWIDFAEEYGALCFQLEHRFYGESRPTPNMKVKSLAFLSSEQALADLAAFITAQNLNLPAGTKWIVFGGSYPGSLAAWARFKYPHLIHGAVSSSGPLLAIADFQDYYEVVQESIKATSGECLQSIAIAQNQLELMLSHRVGQQTVSELFRLCSPFTPDKDDDRQSLFETLSDNVAGIVQYNKDNRISIKPNNKPLTIDDLCNIMNNASAGVEVKRLAQLSNQILEKSNETCLDYAYDSIVANLQNSSWDAQDSEGGRQWLYQTCTEFGFFQTSTRNETRILFGDFPLDLFERQCSDVFGKRFSPDLLQRGINQTNTQYGAFNYKADRIVFVHGSIDPWHALGITKDVSPGAPAIFIEGTAHCADMYPASDKDLPQLKDARKRISALISDWLKV